MTLIKKRGSSNEIQRKPKSDADNTEMFYRLRKKSYLFSITRLFRENIKDLKNTWEGVLKNIFK